MALSSNTLIHFTNCKEALKGILENNFKLKYCRETIYLNELTETLHIPMVSFCDIPLSQIKNHIASYGHYGIGLSREWAIRNKLNPVLYIQAKSNLSKSYEELIRHLHSIKTKNPGDSDAHTMASDIVRYIKNYEAPLNRKDSITEKYRFSDEREWRYVPDRDEDCEMLYTSDQFNKIGAREANIGLTEIRLEFDPDDIKYIIIKSDAEIKEFIEHLRSSKGEKYSYRQIEKLTTRLLTSEQIHSDI